MPKTKVDGININYRIIGDGPHTVLCLPGYLGSIDLDFGKFLEKADKTKFRWVCWDPPGYGESFPPKREFTRGFWENDAEIVWKLMQKLGIKSYSVFGWSQGGATGIFLAANNPESVLKLVTLGTEAIIDQTQLRVYSAMKNVDFWPEENLKRQLKFYSKSYLLTITQDMCELSVDINKCDKGDYLKNAPSMIKCPVLIVHGKEDTTSAVENAGRLHSKIKNSEVKIFPTGKHDLHLTHTEEFLEALEKFLLTS
jgi:valacyclovir hydrolase